MADLGKSALIAQDEINRIWSEDAQNYDNVIQDELNSFRAAAWQEQILSHFSGCVPLKILDVGCGPAFFSIILSAKGHDVTGVDSAAGMLEKARANVAAAGSGARILEMDASDLRFPDQSFDLVVSRNVTHTLLDHARTYAEWRRVLKDGGLLLIYDANWHLTENVPALHRQYLDDWRSCVRRFGSDFSGNTDPDAEPPEEDVQGVHRRLGDLMRPDFDVGVLRAVGFRDVAYTRSIIDKLWDEKEKVLYGTTPMFELRARK